MTKSIKRVSGFLVLAIMLQILVPSFMEIVSANGRDFGSFIKKAEILDKENGSPISGPVSKENSIFINYEFKIDENTIKDLDKDNTLTFPSGITNFPDGHQINEKQKLDLEGYNIKFEVVIQGGEYHVKFYEILDLKADAEDEDDPIKFNISGNFGFEYKFSEEEKQKESIEIDLIYADGQVVEIEFEKEPESESNISNLRK